MAKLLIGQGDDEQLQLTVQNPDNAGTNLTGWTLWFTAYPADAPRVGGVSDTDAFLLAHWVSGGTSLYMSVVTPTTGVVDIEFPAAVTKLLTQRVYQYDLQRKNAVGKIKTIDRGTVVVTPETTQRITA